MLDQLALQGRTFAAEDVIGSAPVVVVSRELARTFWPNQSPLGHTIQMGRNGKTYTVVGLVNDVLDLRGGPAGRDLRPRADLYFSMRQAKAANAEILVRTDGEIETLRSAIIGRLRAVDPMLLFMERKTLATPIESTLQFTKIMGGVLGSLALTAVFLALIGVYGLVAYGVAQRTREIGIRIALGGTAEKIVEMIMREGLRFVLLGVAIGLVLSAGATQLLKWFLFGVSPLDPVAYVAAAVIFGAVALLACYLPARRASRVDAMLALRSE
jgi:ABC-type antimicrobial peptide transport system permease subunit